MAFDYAAKIQGLLANAADESLTEEARASYQAMAEKLMRQYRIDEEQAIATDDAGASVPVFRIVRVTNRQQAGHLGHFYNRTFLEIARHCGIRAAMQWDDGYVAHVVGYEGDIRYAEFLWTAALMMFVTRIDPRWDDTLPETENIWRLRNAGIQRREIADKAWGYGAGLEAKNRSKVQRIYLAESKRRGEPAKATGLGHQTDVYRRAYAESFVETLAHRLMVARLAVDTESGGLVLHGRAERVDEAFYDRFPSHRPTPRTEQAEEYTPCPRCAAAKSGHCRQHPGLTKADYARYDRQENSSSARAGRSSGRVAAEGVTIHRAATVNRVGGSGPAGSIG